MLPGGTDCRYYRGIGGAVAYGANLLEPSLTFGWVLYIAVAVLGFGDSLVYRCSTMPPSVLVIYFVLLLYCKVMRCEDSYGCA